MEIKAIETEYKGYRFRSRLEARWAVFFDACGVEWEYEPEGYECSNGVRYLPDFLLHDVCVRSGEKGQHHTIDLFVEIKGNPTARDGEKVKALKGSNAIINKDDGYCWNAIVVLGNIPDGKTIYELYKDVCDSFYETEGTKCPMWSLVNVLCSNELTIPVIGENGKLVLMDDEFEHLDEAKTVAAYNAARQARFEFGDNGAPGTRKTNWRRWTEEERVFHRIQLEMDKSFAVRSAVLEVVRKNYWFTCSFLEEDVVGYRTKWEEPRLEKVQKCIDLGFWTLVSEGRILEPNKLGEGFLLHAGALDAFEDSLDDRGRGWNVWRTKKGNGLHLNPDVASDLKMICQILAADCLMLVRSKFSRSVANGYMWPGVLYRNRKAILRIY